MNLQKMFESQFLETVPMKAVEQKKRPKENGKRKFYQQQLQRKRKTSEKVQQVHSVSNDCSNKSIGRTVRYYGAKGLVRDELETAMVLRRSAGL